MKWWIGFWKKHGERLVFLILANTLAGVLLGFKLITVDEAKVIFIGSAMLLYNKSRSANGGSNEPPTTPSN